MGSTREPNDGPSRNLAYREEATYALGKSGAERLEALLHADKPMQVIRSLPDRDLYLTIRQVGPMDALPILALASAAQIQHVLDLESWRQDRFDGDRSGSWVAVLHQAGEPTLKRFLRRSDDELLVALFARWARVSQFEFDDQIPIHGSGMTEAGDELGFAAPDGFHRFSPAREEHAPAVRRMAELLFQDEPERYGRLLLDAMSQLPSEMEEQALHWRQSRLEEHGFPTVEEATEIYLPPQGTCTDPGETVPADGADPVRDLPVAVVGEGWVQSLASDLPAAEYDHLMRQFSALANRVLVADHLDTGEPESHQAALRKAVATVGIALAVRFASDGRPAATVVREIPVVELFREGYAQEEAMRQECHRLLRDGWPAAAPNALDLVDPLLRQRLAGLMDSRPLYYQAPAGDASKEQYREFRSLDEVVETRTALDLVRRIGSIFVHHLGLDIPRLLEGSTGFPYGNPRFSTLMMTMMAWHAVRKEIRLEPLPSDVLADFLRTVASRRTADAEAPDRALEAMVRSLNETAGLSSGDGAALHGFGQACLPTLRAECGQLDPGSPLDQRVVSCLLIRQ